MNLNETCCNKCSHPLAKHTILPNGTRICPKSNSSLNEVVKQEESKVIPLFGRK